MARKPHVARWALQSGPPLDWRFLANLLSLFVGLAFWARGVTHVSSPQRSYSGENTASVIARSCSSLALALLVPRVAAWRKDALGETLPVLQAGLPGSPTAEESQAVQFHSGLALGMLVGGTHHQHAR